MEATVLHARSSFRHATLLLRAEPLRLEGVLPVECLHARVLSIRREDVVTLAKRAPVGIAELSFRVSLPAPLVEKRPAQMLLSSSTVIP